MSDQDWLRISTVIRVASQRTCSTFVTAQISVVTVSSNGGARIWVLFVLGEKIVFKSVQMKRFCKSRHFEDGCVVNAAA